MAAPRPGTHGTATAVSALVTGAVGDIGAAVAERLAAAGHAVRLLDLDAPGLARLSAAIDRSSAHPCDVTDPSALASAIEGVDGLAVLVNCAGGVRAPSLAETDETTLRDELALNLEAPAHLARLALPALSRAEGAIVNVASVNALGVFGHPGYAAAKAGLVHLTRSMAVEWGPSGVRANAVAPGTVATRAWRERVTRNPAVLAEARRWCPLGRIATPDDVADAVMFLAGPTARAITGVCLPVDGGLSAGTPQMAATFSQSPHYRAA